MHSHLHTPENANCEEIMTMLDECHARGFLWKALGNCSDIKVQVNKCLGAERYQRAKRNRDKARENRKRIEQIWAEERVREGVVAPADTTSATAGSAEAKQ
ncbi:hypothetical protein DTO271G3_1213 [Paecilomyces variotii]|nr:hypothetical protein DTO271G3_1213 [Paecilomyces variotii]